MKTVVHGGFRVKSLIARRPKTYIEFGFQLLLDNIGVDSGQCGIFDADNYPGGNSTGEYDDKNSFYGKVCELTSNEHGEEADKSIPYNTYGIIDGFGVVSSTGYGDGCYTAYGIKNENGELIAVKIVFLEDETEKDDFYDDDDDTDEDEEE